MKVKFIIIFGVIIKHCSVLAGIFLDVNPRGNWPIGLAIIEHDGRRLTRRVLCRRKCAVHKCGHTGKLGPTILFQLSKRIFIINLWDLKRVKKRFFSIFVGVLCLLLSGSCSRHSIKSVQLGVKRFN